MNKKDYENTAFQDFERIVIYDFADGTHEKLLVSLRRFVAILGDLPQRDTRALWLFDKIAEGPRLGMQYWLLWKDEMPDSDEKMVVDDLKANSKTFGKELAIVTCRCTTNIPDGAIARLFTAAIAEIEKLQVRKLEDISFSKITVENFMEEAVLRLYLR